MKSSSIRPVFIVGCPRSGTTLLQSLLAANPKIASFPETKFFQFLMPAKTSRRQKLGLIARELKPWLYKFFREDMNLPEVVQLLPKIPLRVLYTRKFIKILNNLAWEQGAIVWIEKTPEHIYNIEYIEKVLPNAKIIHLIRNGSDVVASLYEVSHKYPKWWGGGLNIDQCIQRWVEAVEISQIYLSKQNHICVKYENLVNDTIVVLEKLCDFIDVEFDDKMLLDYSIVAKQLSMEEAGRTVISQEIRQTTSTKFYELFDADQQHYILSRLSAVNLDTIHAI